MMRRQRGFSIAEMLTVVVILGVMMTAMLMVLPLMLKAPMNTQAQVDDVNMAAIALYEVRKDFSEGDTSGIMGCQLTPIVLCSAPGAAPTSVQALVVATADDANGHFNVVENPPGAGYPNWQGFDIYWLEPNSNGTSFQLMRAFEPAIAPFNITAQNGVPSNVTAALVTPLVVAALLISPPPVLSNYVASMSLGDDPSTNIISFQLVAGTTGGVDQTLTNFEADTYARN